MLFGKDSAISRLAMDIDIIIGCLVVAGALAGVITLALWSNRTINHIADHGYHTVRETLKELDGDK